MLWGQLNGRGLVQDEPGLVKGVGGSLGYHLVAGSAYRGVFRLSTRRTARARVQSVKQLDAMERAPVGGTAPPPATSGQVTSSSSLLSLQVLEGH